MTWLPRTVVSFDQKTGTYAKFPVACSADVHACWWRPVGAFSAATCVHTRQLHVSGVIARHTHIHSPRCCHKFQEFWSARRLLQAVRERTTISALCTVLKVTQMLSMHPQVESKRCFVRRCRSPINVCTASTCRRLNATMVDQAVSATAARSNSCSCSTLVATCAMCANSCQSAHFSYDVEVAHKQPDRDGHVLQDMSEPAWSQTESLLRYREDSA